MTNPRRVTYQQIEALLSVLGFTGSLGDDRSIVYEHSDAGTMILLPQQRGSRIARDADVLSIERHLVDGGHLDENAFDAFVTNGAFPVSS